MAVALDHDALGGSGPGPGQQRRLVRGAGQQRLQQRQLLAGGAATPSRVHRVKVDHRRAGSVGRSAQPVQGIDGIGVHARRALAGASSRGALQSIEQ